MSELKRCVCGKRPWKINVYNPPSSEYAYATPSCCDYYEFEYKSNYETDLAMLQEFAGARWNELSTEGVPSHAL